MKKLRYTYRVHDFLMRPFRFVAVLCGAIDRYGWWFAHYKNGHGSHLKVPKNSFLQEFRNEKHAE